MRTPAKVTTVRESQQIAKRHLVSRWVPAAHQKKPATFPMHALGKRHLPPSQRTHKVPATPAGAQRLAKRYLSLSQRTHGLNRSQCGRHQRGLIGSPNDTCLFPNAYPGPCDPARSPCGLLNNTCLLPNERAVDSDPSVGFYPHAKRNMPPSQHMHGPQRTRAGSDRLPNRHLPPSQRVQRTQRPSAGTKQARQTTPANFTTHGRDPATPYRFPEARQTTPATFSTDAQASANPRKDRPAPKSTPITFPMHALGKRHLLPATFTTHGRAQAHPVQVPRCSPKETCHHLNACTGHSETSPDPRGSSNDTYHFTSARTGPSDIRNAYKGPSDPALGASSSPNNTYQLPNALTRKTTLSTCHIHNALTGHSNPTREPAARQTTPTTVTTHRRAPAHPPARTGHTDPARCPSGSTKRHLHNTRTGTSNPAQGASGSPNDTYHLPSARTGPSEPVRGASSSQIDTCNIPSDAQA
ncbi:UNVERIFIED_CONTAM: hypothetical protein FKN15_026783 [Acipenser sinensis]